MKVTALRSQRRNKQRMDVFLDGVFAFSLTALAAARLRVGQELTPAEVEQLTDRNAFEEAHDDALRFLSYRARSADEIRRYLERRGFAPEVQQAEVERLQRSGLLDDTAFANTWVENRQEFRPRGRRALRAELRQKGVAPDIIEGALGAVDEESSAYDVAQARAARLVEQGADAPTFRNKLGAFLARRGYGYDIIRQVTARLWRELQGDAPAEEE